MPNLSLSNPIKSIKDFFNLQKLGFKISDEAKAKLPAFIRKGSCFIQIKSEISMEILMPGMNKPFDYNGTTISTPYRYWKYGTLEKHGFTKIKESDYCAAKKQIFG